MSLSRFYLPADEWQGVDFLEFGGDEAHHCSRVLRRSPGEGIEIFDGRGRVATASITAVGREVRVEVHSVVTHPPLPHAIHLMPAMIKGDAFEWLLEKAVELGVASIQPVLTNRCVARLSGAEESRKLMKWRRQMVEAAKQCHTPFLPVLHPVKSFDLAMQKTAAEKGGFKLIPALSGSTRPLVEVLAEPGQATTRCAWIIIGPEGDFTADELAAAESAGFQSVTLGPLVLRAETAGIVAVGVVAQTWWQ